MAFVADTEVQARSIPVPCEAVAFLGSVFHNSCLSIRNGSIPTGQC